MAWLLSFQCCFFSPPTFNSGLTRSTRFSLWWRKTRARPSPAHKTKVYSAGCVPGLDKGRAGLETQSAQSLWIWSYWKRTCNIIRVSNSSSNCSHLQRSQEKMDFFLDVWPRRAPVVKRKWEIGRFQLDTDQESTVWCFHRLSGADTTRAGRKCLLFWERLC